MRLKKEYFELKNKDMTIKELIRMMNSSKESMVKLGPIAEMNMKKVPKCLL